MNVAIFWVLHATYLELDTVLQQSLLLLQQLVSSSHNKPPEPRQAYAGNLWTDSVGERDAENTPALVSHAQFTRCFKQESRQPVPSTVFTVFRVTASESTRFFE